MSDYSIYPNAIDGYAQIPLAVDKQSPVNAEGLNRLRSGIVNIENTLGVAPHVSDTYGEFDDVDDRLENLEGLVSIEVADDEALSATLVAGNTTGGTDIEMTTGDKIVGQTHVEIDSTGAASNIILNPDAAGAVIVNGKLTVTGLIDPTGLILDEAAKPATGANKGALFVSDGTGGLIDNHLYYVFDTGTAFDISGGGTGDVVGPAGVAADNAVVRWDGLTGKLVQDSNTILDDTGSLSLAGSVTVGTEVIITETSAPPSASFTTGRLWVSPGQAPNSLGFVSDNGTLQALPGAWQMAVLHSDQLAVIGFQGMVRQATAFWVTAQPVGGDLFTITDGATTRIYGATAGGDVQYVIGGSVSVTLDNLVAAINGDGASLWDAKHLGAVDFAPVTTDGVVIIYRTTQSVASYTDRIFGDANFVTNTVARYMRFDEAPDYRRIGDDAFNDEVLPNADPGAKRFGQGRHQSGLFGGDVCISILDQTVQILNKTSSPDTWSSIGGGGGGGASLAATLALGNTSGGTDIELTTGDAITGQTDVELRSSGVASSVNIQAKADVNVYPGLSTGVVRLEGRVTIPASDYLHFGTFASPEFGITYFAPFNALLIGNPTGSPAPASTAPGTAPQMIILATTGIDTNAPGVGVDSGPIYMSSGVTTSSGGGTGGNSGEVGIGTGETYAEGDSGALMVMTGDSAQGDSGQIMCQTGTATAAAKESGAVTLQTGTSAAHNTGAIRLTSGDSSGGESGDIELTSGTATGDRGVLDLNTRGARIFDSAPAPHAPNTAGLFVSDGTGTLPDSGATPTANGFYYLGQPSGRTVRLDQIIDRQHINMPESGGNTVQYIGWASYRCVLTKVKVLMVTLNTAGTYTLAITNQAGSTVLSAATFDMNGAPMVANTVTDVPLTGTSSDLNFAIDDKWTIELASSDPAFNGEGIYIDLTFELRE